MTSSLNAARRRRAIALVAVLLGTLLSPALINAPARADHANPPGPVNASTTYGWWQYGVVWREEFVEPLGSRWQRSSPGVRLQHGMLTLNTTKHGSQTATLNSPGSVVGRWETRLRSRQYGQGHTQFRVLTELVPAVDKQERCGGRNIALNSYVPNGGVTSVYARNLPNVAYKGTKPMNLSNDRWHTYAVEVTRERVTWFIDAHAIFSERRDDAFSGVPLTVRFTMQAQPGKTMNPSRMQMDWVRHWTLRAPTEKKVVGAPMREGVYNKAC